MRARIGELGPLTLGHGTLVQDYVSVLTPDQPRVGITARADTPSVGIHAALADVTRPTTFFGRIHARPAHDLLPGTFLSSFTVGASLATDLDSPVSLALDASTSPTAAPTVTETAATSLVGIDAELPITASELVDIRPYVDLVGISTGSISTHVGAVLEANVADAVTLSATGELAWLGREALSRYFGPLYEIDRYQLSGHSLALPAPRRRVAATVTLEGTNTLRADVSLGAPAIGVDARVAYTRALGLTEADSLTASISLEPPQLSTVRLRAFYHRQSFDGPTQALAWDGATLLAAEARVDLAPWLYLSASLDRQFSVDDLGVFEGITIWSAGLGTSWTFSLL